MPSGPDASTVASHSRSVGSVSSRRSVPTMTRLVSRPATEPCARLAAMPLVVLRGGSRDGESTTVDGHVTRLYAASAAPGMVDIYEATTELAEVRGNDDKAIVYEFVGQESTDDMSHVHLPHAGDPGQ